MTRTIDCAACEERLTELICDELSPDDRAVVLGHTRNCASCAKSLGRFRQVMDVAKAIEVPLPSPTLRERIMADAREGLARQGGKARARASRHEGSGSGFFERLAAWARSPQVAMASVLLLVVGIGLYSPLMHSPAPVGSVPNEQRNDEPSATAAPQPSASPAAEAPPSPTPDAPALEEEPGQRAPAKAEQASNALGDKAADFAREASGGGKADQEKSQGLARRSAEGRARLGSAKGYAASASKKNAEPESDLLSLRGEQAFAPPPPPVAQAPVQSAPAEPTTSADQAPVAAQPSPKVASEATRAAPAGPSADDATLASGLAAVDEGRHKDAVGLLTPLLKAAQPKERAAAAMGLGRSYTRIGDCSSAKRYFELAVSAGYDASLARAEAAKCSAQQPTPELPAKE